MQQLLLNYQGFRGKFHILEVRGEGNGGTVAKQIQNRIGFCWGRVTEIDRSKPFKEKEAQIGELKPLVAVADAVQFPQKRDPRRGVDGTWYSLRLGDAATGRVVSWWSDVESELESIYDLRDEIVKTVMRLLRKSK